MAVTGLDPWNFLHIGAPLSTRTALSQAMCQGARLLQFPMRQTPGMVRTTLESSVSYSKAQTNIFDRYSSSPLSRIAHASDAADPKANCTTLEHCGTKGSALTRGRHHSRRIRGAPGMPLPSHPRSRRAPCPSLLRSPPAAARAAVRRAGSRFFSAERAPARGLK